MAVRECVWMCAYVVPTYTSALAGLGRWIWGAVDYWCMQPRRARTSAYREACVRVESCVPWWKAGSHQTCVHVDLFSPTKLAASTVVAWWGLQDRHTAGGIQVAELGATEAQGEGTSPPLAELDIPGTRPGPAHLRVGRIQSRPSKPGSAPPLLRSCEWGGGRRTRLGNRP